MLGESQMEIGGQMKAWRTRTARSRDLVSGLLGLLAFIALAHRPAAAAPSYTVRSWGIAEGLPTSTVQDIAQTPDGYLWVSTTGGLARFDGVRFETFGPQQGLPSNRVQGLGVSREGRLLASCEDGSLVSWDGRAFQTLRTGADLAAHSLLVLSDDSVLGTTLNDLWYLRSGKVRMLLCYQHWWTSYPQQDAQGRIWLTTEDSIPARLDGDRVVNVGPQGRQRDRWVSDHRDGSVCLRRTAGRDVELLDTSMRLRVRLPGAADEVCFLIDPHGLLWSIDGPDLVIRDARDGAVLVRKALGISDPVQHVFMDREQNFWIGTRTQGLIRVTPSPLRVLTPPGAATPGSVLGACELPGGTVLGVDGAGQFWRVDDSTRITSVPGEDAGPWGGTPAMRYRSRFVSGGLTGKARTELRDASGHSTLLPFLTWQVLAAIPEPGDPRTIFVNSEADLYRLSVAPGVPHLTALMRPRAFVRDARFDGRGRLWVSTTNGLWRFAPGDTQRFTVRDGLPTDHTRQLLPGRGDTLWIGTYGGGLVRYAGGRFRTLTRKQGLLEDVVSVVLDDDAGDLWLAGNAGIQRVSKAQVEAVLDGRRDRVAAVPYGREAGLRNPEGSGYPGRRTSDGRLWFPTLDGLAEIDPKLARTMLDAAPTPMIEDVVAGGDRAARGERGFVLKPGQRRFTIRYTGIHLRAPEQVRFRYRLEGFDRDWIDAGEVRNATYTNVPPGRHVFRVIAISGNGNESPASASAVLDLQPYFFETWWFRLLALAALVLVLVAAWRERSGSLLARAAELQSAVEARTADLVSEQARTEGALATVEAQASRLEALDRARSRFFASISHELRTPLTLIQGPLQDVSEGAHGLLPADAQQQVGIALDSAARLHRLVDQLLDAARAESGELRVQPRAGDLMMFLADLCQSYAPLAERKHIVFTRSLSEAPLPATFDPQALEKVFANLLGNAFKFTQEGGHVALSATLSSDSAQGPAVLVVQVTDDGPGIAAADLPHVFKRFYRAEQSVTRVQPGTGLGLALAQDMIEQHDGSIEVESAEGRGCTFTVRLPVRAAAAIPDNAPITFDAAATAALADEIRIEPETALPGPLPESEDSPTVLVAEDHPDVRAYVVRHLRREYRVIEAANGTQALAAMRESAPDLVVSDVSMPGMTGFELCAAIRHDPELDFIPVILLTAAASSEHRVEGIEGGADDYLTKPFVVRELLARIAQMLHSRRRLRERLTREAAQGVMHGTLTLVPEPAAGTSPMDAAFLRRLHEVIEARMGDEELTVDQIAEAMGVGRTLLFKQVGTFAGSTPMQLLYERRLQRAAHLLDAGDGNVGEVAYAVGFRSLAHFTNRFRSRFGVTPSEWKRGARPETATGS